MRPPRKAVVLAAGYGARLLQLTLCRPKPLCPIWGKPALVHALERLREWGVCDVLVNVHCHAGKIVEYLRLNPIPGLRCQISFEADVLGTGGVLPHARWFLDDDPFWMMNADVLADVPCAPLLKSFASHSALAALWLLPDSGPRTVETEGEWITSFRSTRPGSPGTATFSGLHLVSPRILKFLPEKGETSIVVAYEQAMRAGETILGVRVPDSYWADIGTPKSYLQAHRDIAARAATRRPGHRLYSGPPLSATSAEHGFRVIGRNVAIAPSAHVSNAVIWDNVTLGAQASVTNAIIGDNVSVNGPVSYMALRADTLADPELDEILQCLDWPSKDTSVFPLPPRGSARTFTRLQCRRRKAILVR
jgi:NDP-sugar pyrophosphorylase family protein